MKHFLAFGTFIVSGALIASACTASDSEKDPDASTSAGGNGGSTNSVTGDNTGSGGTTTSTTGSGGSGTTTSSTGSGGSAGDSAGGAAGAAGETWQATTGESTTGEGGSAGMPIDCHGDEVVNNLPSCDDLPFSDVECSEFDPPEPLGMSLCKEWAANGTDEAFEELFACLNQVDTADHCSSDDTEHDDAARECVLDVTEFVCRNAAATTRCATLGCDEVGTEPDGECDVLLSSMTPAGIQHVVDCTNDGTGDEPGGTWGTPPEPPVGEEPTCGQVFRACVEGLLQPGG